MKELPEHSELAKEMTWDLNPMYRSTEEWDADFAKIDGMLKKLLKFKGKLQDPVKLADAFRASDALGLLVEKLYTFAHLKSDENTGDSVPRGRVGKISAKDAEIDGKTAWFEPELLRIPAREFKKLLAAPELQFYRRTLLDIDRDRPYTLSEKEEKILGMSSDVFGGAGETFSVLNDADLKFPLIPDGKGGEVRLTHGNYVKFLESPDREVRKNAFKGCYRVYSDFKNTFASLLETEVKTHILEANLRGFSSSLEASLHEDAVPTSVYESLISTVRANFAPLHRYFKVRAGRLGLRKIDMYDIHCPLVPAAAREVSWKEAVQSVREALLPLGGEYASVLNQAFEKRWMDVPECKGKRSGAYSSGCYGYPPYLLLNFNGTLDSVFTLAHELGHSMHSWFSDHANDYHYAGYKIFVAEVASTTNEILLQHHLVSRAKSESEKAYLLCHLIDTVRATLFRQTMFAEFELDIHRMAEQGEPLTADELSERYFKLNADYHGTAVTPDSDIRYEWARIPHFHYDFYVYKYATGISAALALAKKILAGDTEGYLNFLKAGDSKDVIDIMKDAGVDFTTPAPVEDAMRIFAEQTVNLEKCLKKIK